MKKSTAIILMMAFASLTLLICCVGAYLYSTLPSVNPVAAVPPENPTELATNLPTTTAQPSPTSTPEPTATPEPTEAPPTATHTPEPDPILLSGSGDSVVDLNKWDGAAIAVIRYSGSSYFSVQNVDAGNNHIDLLVSEIGSFAGTVPIDFADDEDTKRFEITASGEWTIEVKPMAQANRFIAPGILTGVGPDVVIIQGTQPLDKLVIDALKANSHFSIWGYGRRRDLLVSETAPYSGTVLIAGSLAVDEKNLALIIQATGPWSIEVATR